MVCEFLARHHALATDIDAPACLEDLLHRMEDGLSGGGKIPMLPSFLPPVTDTPVNKRCCVLDAGGTNLRIAEAYFDTYGRCHIGTAYRSPMPGSRGAVTGEEFFSGLAREIKILGQFDRIGFCFSYNVEMSADLDGTLLAWCKEVDIPDVVGQKVGASLARAVALPCRVHVLNDSVAAMLGASEPVRVGIILGTGVNVCYPECSDNIPKLKLPLHGSMIISTEVGEFDGIPLSDFERQIIAATDAPSLARAEKQCSGGYLGESICLAWHQAACEGLLPQTFTQSNWPLSEISAALAGSRTCIPTSSRALDIAEAMIHRAAKIAAILCAAPVLRCSKSGETVPLAVEGSQYWQLTGFREAYHNELDALLSPHEISIRIIKTEDSCLRGAALAAFAQPMI